jgi:hypothetical protein
VGVKLTPDNRVFTVGHGRVIEMRDCGRVALEADEQVTFTTPKGGQYDVARKSWGFYATPSTNARLPKFGLRTALVRNAEGRFYVFLVERGHEEDFQSYLRDERNAVVAWLDDEAALRRLEQAFPEGGG